jgi:hypothetical protein
MRLRHSVLFLILAPLEPTSFDTSQFLFSTSFGGNKEFALKGKPLLFCRDLVLRFVGIEGKLYTEVFYKDPGSCRWLIYSFKSRIHI